MTRWRADEGAIIRIPVYRHEKLADLDRTVDRLDARHGRSPTEAELVTELGWDEGDVKQLMQIPRLAAIWAVSRSGRVRFRSPHRRMPLIRRKRHGSSRKCWQNCRSVKQT